ncbi:ABC transporter ATP-binding protein, partial [Nocardia wallacei]|uniref:ABC transporter ATP-binding protein n=1 Tax=Nocardia wallacei TaxID=480035 RepID=UPI00245839C1
SCPRPTPSASPSPPARSSPWAGRAGGRPAPPPPPTPAPPPPPRAPPPPPPRPPPPPPRAAAPWAGPPGAPTTRQDDDETAIAAALAATDTEHLAARPFPALSGGERARVALARVLAQDTPTLLLDEPTAALDLGHQEQVLRLARARAGHGAAVVVVLHDLGIAAAYADRVAVLESGHLAACGPPRDILTTTLLSRVYQHPVEVFDHPRTGAQLVLPARG